MLDVFTANVLIKLLTTIVENSPLGDEADGGGYTPPLIDDIERACVDTDVAAVSVDTIRLGDTDAAGGYAAPFTDDTFIKLLTDIGTDDCMLVPAASARRLAQVPLRDKNSVSIAKFPMPRPPEKNALG